MTLEESIDMLVDCGYDVMLHARADESCEHAGTARYVVEIDRYPHCVTTQCEGTATEALAAGVSRFFEELDAEGSISFP